MRVSISSGVRVLWMTRSRVPAMWGATVAMTSEPSGGADDLDGAAVVGVGGSFDEAECFDFVDDSRYVTGADHELFGEVDGSAGVLG